MSWNFTFQKNVYMYNHRLTCQKGGKTFNCSSEDSPKDSAIHFWLDGLPLTEQESSAFLADLEAWASTQGFKFRIYFEGAIVAFRL